MKRVFLMMVAVAVLAGCNTVAGVGKDIERAGEAIQRSTK
ncbi:MAG: entericidin A/B family lipoprotein [Betaproteobacteria bacterium]|nr:entericidin A/B family lipoprotein [Betaproteobacteria bacterium]